MLFVALISTRYVPKYVLQSLPDSSIFPNKILDKELKSRLLPLVIIHPLAPAVDVLCHIPDTAPNGPCDPVKPILPCVPVDPV